MNQIFLKRNIKSYYKKKRICLLSCQNCKVFYTFISNALNYNTFFNSMDFQILISCRQLVKKNLRDIYGQFYIGPFFLGQGLTVANALRRTLLSELSSLAITSVQIQDVVHQYQTIQGLQESVFDFLLNLKEIVLKSNKFIQTPQIGYLQIQGPCIIKAKDLFLPSLIQCVDPEQYIATLSEDGCLNLKFIIRQGKNSITHINSSFDTNSLINNFDLNEKFSENQNYLNKHIDSLSLLNTYSKNLIIDASFNPVVKVNYMIELLNFDQLLFEKEDFIFESNNLNIYQKNKTNFIKKEIIILEIWTNGSISPVTALKISLQKLIRIFLKTQKSKILNTTLLDSDKCYKNVFEKLSKQFNKLKSQQSQTLYDSQDSKIRHISEKYLIQKLKYLINQLESF